MIKRASTILLTLFLLLVSANSLFATEILLNPITTVTFTPNEGSSSTSLDDFNCPGAVSLSASANANITSSGLVLKKGTGTLFTFTLKDASTVQTKYDIVVELASGTSAQFRFIVTNNQGHLNYNPTGQEWGYFTGRQSFSTYAQGGSASFSIEINNNAGSSSSLTVKSIKISGYVPQKIVSDNGDDLCAGEDNTFTALGLSGNVTWTLDGNPISNAKASGNTITFSPTEGGTLKAVSGGTTLTFPFTTRFCCAVNADRKDVAIETFTFKNSSDKIEDINNGIRTNIRTGYQLASGLDNIKEDQYAIIKSTDGTWGNWYRDNGATIVYGHTRSNSDIDNAILPQFNQANGKNSSYDGFIAVNCNVNTYSKNANSSTIFQYQASGICTNTYHDFSAFISNIDAKASEADINVKFLVKDAAGNTLLDRETGYVKCGNQSWKEYGGSFETKGNDKVILTLFNNNEKASPNSDGNIVGNDVAVDDIRFSRCVPRINVHFNTELTAFESNECNNTTANKTINLYIGHHDYNVAEILDGAYFLVLQNTGTGWERVSGMSSGPIKFDEINAQNTVTATIVPNQGRTEYKAIVAPSKTDVELIEGGATSLPNNCSVYNITRADEIAVLKPACVDPCDYSISPEMNSYLECPTSEDKIDLKTLIKSIKKVDGTSIDLNNISNDGELTWYNADDTELPSSEVSFPRQGETDTYKVRFKQKDTATDTYCISDHTTFTVGIKGAIELSLVEDNIALCYNTEKEIDENRTFYTEISDETLTNITYKWTDKDGNTISGATGSSYTLPLETLGTGKITVIAEDNDKNLCASKPKVGTYEILKEPKLDITIDVPCEDKLVSDGIKLNFTNIASDTKSWFEIDRLSDASNKEYASVNHISPDLEQEQFDYKDEEKYVLTDKFVASENPTKVQYKILFANTFSDGSWCSFEKVLPNKDEYYDITDTNQFYLTSNAKDINEGNETATKAEYHVCVGNEVKITSSYDLKAGEIYEWYVKIGDEDFVKDATEGSEDSKFFTIAAIEKTTIVKVDIVDDPDVPGNETCGGSATITINVDEMPKIQSKDVYICEDDADGIQLSVTGGEKYKWSPTTGLSATDISNPIAKVSKTTTYTVDVYKGQCKNDTTVVVNVNNLPEITSIEPVSEEEKGNMVVTIVKEVGDTYSYSLDGENYAELPLDNIIKDLPIGWSLLYIKNDTTTCVNSKEFYIAPIEIKPDKFFSPNGDGNNDKWEVEHLNSYDSYIVEIFDRHSKRLFIQRVGSFNIGGTNTVDGDEFEGWNGEYNGKPMPSDDYWYLITVEDIRKQYTGHFTLKR